MRPRAATPALPVSCSADVVAEYREFERFSTTVLNAYLQPLMEGYLAGLEERLLATGYAHGVLTVASSGGMMTTETARRLPIKTIFSGPAGGVSQACFVGAAAGVPRPHHLRHGRHLAPTSAWCATSRR